MTYFSSRSIEGAGNPRVAYSSSRSIEGAGTAGVSPASAMSRIGLVLAVLMVLLTVPATADWKQFRGEPTQKGIADSPLPQQLVPIWTFRVPEGAETTPAIGDGRIYLGGLGGTFHAVDLATGKSLWAYEVPENPEIKSSALVWDGVVYFGDEFGFLNALDAESGQERWRFEAGAAITGSPNRLETGCLVVGSYDNHIYCIDRKDGSVQWKQETEGYIHGTPAVTTDGQVISSGCDGFLRVLSPTGEVAAELQIGSYVAGSPAIEGQHVFVGNFDNEVLSVDLAKGDVAWRYSHPERDFPFYSSPAVHQGLVVIGGRDKMVHALDAASGQSKWTHRMRARVEASPVVTGDRVVVADTSGLLQILSLQDGSVSWEFEASDGFSGSPAVTAGYLVIAALDGTLYAFADPSKRPSSSGPAL
ncbi:MAG: PQQ-binding-like beta-propeller repeat protein [Thermoanaerobaculia bacterium]|nr:PQQ-binding-like beta-propeller repeat protein [Thermoanaerobaculia bacterium]